MAFLLTGGCIMKKIYTLYILIISQGLSLIGSRMSAIAIGIWLYKTKGSATYLLLIPFFNEIAAIIFGGIAGAAADKWKRKHAMILGDLGQAMGTLILFLSIATNSFQVPLLYVVVAVQGVFSLFESIAADAATTMLVTEEHREKANAMKEMAFPLAGVAAPVFSGVLYGTIGIKGILIIDLATFIIAVIVLFAISIPDPEKDKNRCEIRDSFLKESLIGFEYLIKHAELLKLTLYITFTNFMLNGPLELVIPYITKITGSEFLVSVMLGLMSFGAFTGAAIIAVWGGTRPRIHTLLIGMILNGIMFILFGIARMPLILGASIFIFMIPLPASNALFKSIIQVKTPPQIQGRVFAAISQLSYIVVPVSFLLTGYLVDNLLEPLARSTGWRNFVQIFGAGEGAGMGLLLTLTGAVILIVTIFVYTLPSIRKLEARLPDYEA